MTVPGESRWPRVADLPLVVEDVAFERLHAVQAHGAERVTTHVRLSGRGTDGLGEDVAVHVEDGTSLHEWRPALGLTGSWTLAAFAAHLDTLDLFPAPPAWDLARNLRRWALESAALDLALRQAGRPLHEVLGLEPRPVRFVNSLGLGEAPSLAPLTRRIERAPTVRFKIDAQATWPAELVAAVAATGAVDTVDFKGRYELPVEDEQALLDLYDRVLAAFPAPTVLEDPHDRPALVTKLAAHRDRISFDAPIASADDIEALGARIVNVKPSRIGSLERLLGVYAHCERHGLPMYGGGMGELGVGRGQIELLASLFHPDAANDVAPSAFNEDEPAAPLPASPLTPAPQATGFRW